MGDSCTQYICTTTQEHKDPFIEYVEEDAVELFEHIVRLVSKMREKGIATQWNSDDIIQRMKEIATVVSSESEKKAKALIETFKQIPQPRSRFILITRPKQDDVIAAM